MGGSGSGFTGIPKKTVEDCLTLDGPKLFREFNKAGKKYPFTGQMTWERGGRIVSALWYTIEKQRIGLSYNKAGEDFKYYIGLDLAPQPKGGHRYYFICLSCKKRAGKLYLPAGGKLFACRGCHDLTYNSCQKGKKRERFTGLLRGMLKKYGYEVPGVL